MTQITCSAILFDMDGVLIDSTPAVARVWRKWALDHGFEPEGVIANAHGRPSLTTIREYLPNADHEAENCVVEQAEIDDIEGIVPLPGTMELLSRLPRERWAIVTSCTRKLAEVRIRAAGLPIPDLFLTSSEVVNGKPHPEPYLKAAAKLGFAPERCIVLEDAPAGIRAGKAAGARVVALTTTASIPELQQAGADWILKDCSQISVEDTDKQLVLSLNI